MRIRWTSWLLAMVFASPAFGASFEGRYAEVPFPQATDGAGVEVREFFWYGCPHCYALEPALDAWLKGKPKGAVFVRTPGTSPNWLLHAQAYYAFEAMGALDKLHMPFYEALHARKQKFASEDAIAAFVQSQGQSVERFRDAFRSFGVRLNLEKAKRLSDAYAVNTVPTIIVGGKYQTSPAMAGGEAATMEVVDYLVRKVADERRRAKGGPK